MKYIGVLVKKEREEIFALFLNNTKLKFNEIEKQIKIRSNMVSYHLEKMQKEGILEKKEEYYYLTKKSERYIPIFSNIIGQEMSPLPVVLVAIVNKGKILMIKRSRRPYKDYWSLIGGKMTLEENFEQASLRQVKQKTKLEGKYVSINSVMHERVEGDDMIKHSFILFFTKVSTTQTELKKSEFGELKWVNISKVDKENIIPSDLWLIKNKLNSKISVKDAYMHEKDGELTSFKVLK